VAALWLNCTHCKGCFERVWVGLVMGLLILGLKLALTTGRQLQSAARHAQHFDAGLGTVFLPCSKAGLTASSAVQTLLRSNACVVVWHRLQGLL
jgi:hypothetical protein